MKKSRLLGAVCTIVLAATMPISANAVVIGFEDLTTRNNFNALGIIDNYMGYEWGFGNGPGVANRIFVNNSTGWASATITDPALSPPPGGIQGSSYAWNWNAPQSLWIDFKESTDFTSGLFSIASSSFGGNASSIQLFGYDASSNLVSSSSVLSLTNTLQILTANFNDIHYLEIRADSSAMFAMDDLVANSSVVPVPAAVWLFGSGLLGLVGVARKKAA